MFGSAYRIATVAGIPIRIHISLLLIVLILGLRFGWVSGTLLGVALVLSIVLHELGHSAVAIRSGCRVRSITLLCIGGAAQMEEIPSRPRAELLMAVAGPAVSLVLGLSVLMLGLRLPGLPEVRGTPLNLVELIGVVNLGLVAFNLLPAFPMDGGRVLRAALTPRLGRLKATFIAARVGKIIAVLFGVRGFFTYDWILVVIAFFVFTAASNEYNIVRMQEAAKRGRRVWPGFEEVFGGEHAGDQAVIGPPPFKRGRGARADIYTEERED
jgi:Zn-dependent protease